MLQVGILKGGIDMYLDYNSSETNNGGIDPQLSFGWSLTCRMQYTGRSPNPLYWQRRKPK